MFKLLFISFVSFFTCVLFSCNSAKIISGKYQSKFPVGGFFGTMVNLKSDSTFTYRMKGDLSYDTAAGRYQIIGKFLILNYKSLTIDTSSEYEIMKESLSIHEEMNDSKNLHQPIKYLIGYNKLFLTDKNGRKVKKQWGYSRLKKYILFGKRWRMMKFYLKRQ